MKKRTTCQCRGQCVRSVSPSTLCMPLHVYNDFVNTSVCDGRDADIADAVREEDALLSEPIIGTKPTPKKEGVTSLPMPKEMTPAQLREHMVTHLPYHEGCPYCVAARRPNSPHRRCPSHSRHIPHMTAENGFLKAKDESIIPFSGHTHTSLESIFRCSMRRERPRPKGHAESRATY